MKKAYISRHNEAVRIIQAAVRAGELGQSVMFMDASPAANLPQGVEQKTLPDWILPNCPHKPDIAIVRDLHRQRVRSPDWCPPTGPERANYCIHIVELGFTDGRFHQDKQLEKSLQHATLAAKLREAGWKVQYQATEAVSVGYAGSIGRDLVPLLRSLGIEHKKALATATKLHTAAVRHHTKIQALWWALNRKVTKKPGGWGGS
jgi:hypothetical protein